MAKKYIDADLLRKEIEKHIKEVKDAAERFTPDMGFFDAKLSGIYDVMAIIDSLQQEQPESLKGKFVFPNFLYARTVDANAGGYRDLHEGRGGRTKAGKGG